MKRQLVWGAVGCVVTAWVVACASDGGSGTPGQAGAAGMATSGAGDGPASGGSALVSMGGAAAGESTVAGGDAPGGTANESGGPGTGGHDGGQSTGGYGTESSGAGGRGEAGAGQSGTGQQAGAGGEGGGCGSVDLCVNDPAWTCETFHDCPWGWCSEVDHTCHPGGYYGAACDAERPCLAAYNCIDGVCGTPLEYDDVWRCVGPEGGCQPGEFCREYALAVNGEYCAAVEHDFTDYPCVWDGNCGPRFECPVAYESCELRPEAETDCSSNPNICGRHYYCDPASDTCRGRNWDPCSATPDSCPVYTFCNAAKQCEKLPGLGQPCRQGQCDATLKCEKQPDPQACESP